MLNKIKKINYKYFALALMLIAIAIICVFIFKKNNQPSQALIISRQNLAEIVEASGKVEAAQSVALSFERSGTVSKVSYKSGDRVVAGNVIASLSLSDSSASIAQARASLQREEAVLAQIQSGATVQEKAIKEQVVTNAKIDLENNYLQVNDLVRDAYAKYADILNYKLTSTFNRQANAYNLSFTSCDQTLQVSTENTRLQFDTILKTLENYSNEIDTDNNARKDDVLDDIYKNTISLNNFITDTNTLLNQSCVAQNANLDTQRVKVAEIKSTVNTIFTNISAKKSVIQSSKSAISRAERDLDLIVSPPDINKIEAQSALVSSAKAKLAQEISNQEKNILRAPFTGIITNVNISKGEIANTNQKAVSMISEANFQIEIEVSENDISKISKENKVDVILDAFSKDKIFEGYVERIDPAPVSSSVGARYRVILAFKENYEDMKVGMTANAKIVTNTKENVLSIPPEYLMLKNGKYFVKVKNGNNFVDQEVIIGIRSGNGDVEIISGISENQKVFVDNQ